ncbi:hypothetical protein PR048_025961 [Dryococelus australis]|uniref:Uncharacterized protein n=1 Tax=Dryococelus australis TaxID=614101 RepID=A0ABQ9GK13_9NEOP|nr:hypothetical protein PR048_025961 [Dryococelus australis]
MFFSVFIWGRCSRAISTLASNQDEPEFNPRPGPQDFRKCESCRTMLLVGGFSRGSPVSPAPYSLQSPLIGSQDLTRLDYSPPAYANRAQFPAGLLPDFRHGGIVPEDAANRQVVFSGISRFSSPSFRHCSVLTSLQPHRVSTPRY